MTKLVLECTDYEVSEPVESGGNPSVEKLRARISFDDLRDEFDRKKPSYLNGGRDRCDHSDLGVLIMLLKERMGNLPSVVRDYDVVQRILDNYEGLHLEYDLLALEEARKYVLLSKGRGRRIEIPRAGFHYIKRTRKP